MAAAKRPRFDTALDFEETLVQNAFRNSHQEIDLKPKNDTNDLRQFLTELGTHCRTKFLQLLQIHKGIKVWFVIEAQYSPLEKQEKTLTGYLRTKALVYHNSTELDDDIQKHMKELEAKNATFMRAQSGHTMRGLSLAKICVSKHLPLVGRSFKELPYLLKQSKSIINPDNTDERCFGYAILAALHPQDTHVSRSRKYDVYFSERGLDKLNYPVSPEDVPGLEEQLQLNINIFSFYDDEGMGKYPLFVSRQKFPNKSTYSSGMGIMPGSKILISLCFPLRNTRERSFFAKDASGTSRQNKCSRLISSFAHERTSPHKYTPSLLRA